MQSLLASLGLVFVAELGDKTQLVALGFGARHRLGPVLAGVAIAYAVSNQLSVVVGGLVGIRTPTPGTRRASTARVGWPSTVARSCCR